MFLDVSWSALELFYIELLIKIYKTYVNKSIFGHDSASE